MQAMARIMAFDYGKKRTGIAVTDPLQIIATGLTTVETEKLMDFLIDYLRKEDVERFVIGEPVGLDGQATDASEAVDEFIQSLKKQFPGIPVDKEDERFTSKMAVQTLVKSGIKKKKRRDKKLIDQVSATIILQSYLGHTF